jgi:hypothetical protein
MIEKAYAWLIALALIGLGGWYVHHRIYQDGYAAAQKADNKALDAAADTNAAMQRVLAVAENAAAECADGRKADEAAAQRAAEAATQERDKIAKRAALANKKLSDLMAGECRDWAKMPACGSAE